MIGPRNECVLDFGESPKNFTIVSLMSEKYRNWRIVMCKQNFIIREKRETAFDIEIFIFNNAKNVLK